MCPMVNPLVQGGAPAGAAAPAPAESPAEIGPTGTRHLSSGFNMGNLGGGLTHPDNTSAHVAAAVVLAFGVIILFKVAGFRFAVDAGVAGGR